MHRASAVVLAGVGVHRAEMEGLRYLYRAPPVEALLLASVRVQLAAGLWLFIAGVRAHKGALAWLQAESGLALGGHLAVHVAAVLFGRHQLQLETDLCYVAASMQLPVMRTFFAHNYFADVLVLFVHVGCALYRLRQRGRGHRGTAGRH